jgi:hypothetical protein
MRMKALRVPQYLGSSMARKGLLRVDRGYLRVTHCEPIKGRYGITESRTGPACFLLKIMLL